jgi:hypothetical protein
MVDAVQRIDLLVQSGGGGGQDRLVARQLAQACAT